MKKGMAAFTLFVLMTVTSQKCLAWGKEGHEMVAEIAFRFMDDSTKKIVKSFLGNLSIEEASTWMDDSKSNSYYNYMRTWHYVNVDSGQTYKPSTERDIITVLNSAILDLKNYKNLSKKDVKRDLLLIFHLIGDLHQPLHVGYGIDRGGNSIEITSPVVSGNLHGVWDSQIIQAKGITIDSCLAIYPTLDAKAVSQIQKISVLTWMNQSRSLLNTVYGFKNNFLSPEYIDQNVAIIERQLLYGGLRLASILNEAFAPGKKIAEKS
ncbi:MAG: S1/P1 nuclease [Ferruginibacter sp.]